MDTPTLRDLVPAYGHAEKVAERAMLRWNENPTEVNARAMDVAEAAAMTLHFRALNGPFLPLAHKV